MPFSATRLDLKIVVTGALCILSLACLTVAIRTAAWPLLGDSSLIHYVVFQLGAGHKPYAQIGDINLPGAYLADWLVMHILGGGPLAERLYDYSLFLVSAWAAWQIAPRRFRYAGLFAAMMFFLLHARDGAEHTGQRDWTMAVLVLLALTAWMHAGRKGNECWRVVAGCLIGCAATIKPVALFFLVPLMLEPALSSTAPRRFAAILRSSVQLALGASLPIAGCVLWLWRKGALQAFLSIGLERIRFHASLHRLPPAELIAHGISGLRVPLLLGAALLPFVWKQLRNAEFALLCIATGAGELCYAVQGKGHPYHRYAFAFLLLETVGVIFLAALSSEKRSTRWAGVAALGICGLWLGPQMAVRALKLRPQQDQFGAMLHTDLEQLGGASLDGRVQCLDTFSGCIRVLYEMRLHQSTGLMYDEFLFGPKGTLAILNSRAQFFRELRQNPPAIFIVTSQDYSGPIDTYAKVEAWPWFAEYLEANYKQCVERTPQNAELWEGAPRVPLGYRLYLRNGLTNNCAALRP